MPLKPSHPGATDPVGTRREIPKLLGIRPDSLAMTEETAAIVTGPSSRFIPCPLEPALYDEHAGHRCQLGTLSAGEVTVDYVGSRPVKATVAFFTLIAFGKTWADAVANWKGRGQ